ncbi:hypothetical protein AAVH_32346, partial [Aphelenchoides avenae]
FGDYPDSIKLSPDHWTSLMNAIRSGAVRRLQFSGVDLSSFSDNAFLIAIGCRGLQLLALERSVVPGGLVVDDAIRSSVEKCLLELSLCGNKSDTPHRVSEAAVLDFFFRADAAAEGQSLSLKLEGTGIADKFINQFFERVLSSPARPSGSFEFYGAPKQRVRSAYAPYLAPGGTHGRSLNFRFPLADHDDDKSFYSVALFQGTEYMRVELNHVRLLSSLTTGH